MVLLAIGAGAAWGAYQGYLTYKVRTLRVCVVTDFEFRAQEQNWQYPVALWLAEVNRAFAPAKIQFEPVFGGDAYDPRTQGKMADRRELMEEGALCQADILLGLTGRPREDTDASMLPFGHSLLLRASPSEPAAVTATALARGLGNLFGVESSTRALVATAGSPDSIFNDAALTLIRQLRYYPFASGIDGLDERWTSRSHRALEEYMAGTSQNPAADGYRLLARTYAGNRHHRQAIAQYRKAIAVDPRDALLRVELALELKAEGETDTAIQQLREAAKLDPEDARPHVAIGIMLLNSQRPGEALDALRTAIQIDPRNAKYFSLLGMALSSLVGGGQKAEDAFQAALRVDPKNPSALDGLLQLQNRPEKTRENVDRLQAALKREPASTSTHVDLALALAEAGNVDAAWNELRQAVAADPRNLRARIALVQMHYLGGDYTAAQREADTAKANGVEIPAALLDAIKRAATQ